jgi:two-component system OmpR family sensor kinase
MLGGTVLVTGLLATAVTFFIAYSEAKEFQDHMLRQVGVLLESNGKPAVHGQKPAGFTTSAGEPRDPEERIHIYWIPQAAPAKLFDISLQQGIQTLKTADGRLRCYVHKNSAGNVLAVTQPVEMRNELAFDSALHVFTPVILLLPLMTLLITQIVRRELKPVKKMANHLDAQPADQPRSLPDGEVIAEIDPFVQAINRLLGRVNVLMTQQRRFIADAAHELRSPLTALSLQIQNLETVKSPDDITKRMQSLKSGVERANKLTEQLLDLARVQLGVTESEHINVSALARRLIEEYLPMAEAKNIDLGLDEQMEIQIMASEKNLRLIMKNGLENALKYTPAGGVVTIRLYVAKETAYCEVVDSGPGIDEAVREQIFDPFFRPLDSGQEGNGLGLAIAREAAANLGGKLELLANDGQSGLSFRYSQPVGAG